MASTNEPLYKYHAERIVENARFKRAVLVGLGYQRSKRWRFLNFLAGFLALLSAGSMAAIIAELSTSLIAKLVAALLSLVSGLTTLLIASYYDERDTRRVSEGAAKFLALRDQANLLLTRTDLSEKQSVSSLKSLQDQYAEYSAEFDHYIDPFAHSQGGWVPISQISPAARHRMYDLARAVRDDR